MRQGSSVSNLTLSAQDKMSTSIALGGMPEHSEPPYENGLESILPRLRSTANRPAQLGPRDWP
jgi:hypothetical protein